MNQGKQNDNITIIEFAGSQKRGSEAVTSTGLIFESFAITPDNYYNL